MMMGVYKITNTENNKVYIGSSNSIIYRWNQHIEKLIYNIHENYKLQRDFNKYGISSFKFSVLEIVDDKKNLLNEEQKWIDRIDVESNYNILSYSRYDHIERIKDNYKILDFQINDEVKNKLLKNISICNHLKLNEIGSKKTSLSKSWYNKHTKEHFDKIRKNTYNFHRNICNGDNFYWTTFISYQRVIAISGIIKRYVSLTDIPKEKANNLAYLVNNFPNPEYKRKIGIDDDEYALKIMLKWIINVSNINKPINIYIPSSRMRNLLINWLDEINKL